MTTNHKHYLDLAFQLAKKNLGCTKLNPSVGSIVVKNNSVISSGVTSINGRPHSEFNALNKFINFSGSTLYTTLEPCTHYGKTPPCVNIIIKKKIKIVFYACEDPDKRTYKKAKKILNKKGVKTFIIKSRKYNNFYKSYFINKKFNIPLIAAKIASSNDFLTINKKSKWITNEASRKVAHLLRSYFNAILSTSKSINSDNSLLNCRIPGLNNYKPDLFIIDLNLKLKKNLLLNKIIRKRNTYLITKKNNIGNFKSYRDLGYKIIILDSLSTKKDFQNLYRKIYKLGYSRLLIETGLTFLNSLIKNKVIHDLYIFKSAMNLSQNGKNNSSSKNLKNIKPKLIQVNLNNDKLYKKEF